MSENIKSTKTGTKSELLKAAQLERLVRDIKKERSPEKLRELVQRFHQEQRDKFEALPEKQRENSRFKHLDPLQNFWVQLNNNEQIKMNPDFEIINEYVFRFQYKEPKEILQGHPCFQPAVDACFARLTKKKQFKIMDTMNRLFEFDKNLSIRQGSHIRNSIRVNPFFIIHLMANGLQDVSKIPENEITEVIKALLDITVKIVNLPNGKGWTWLINVILLDVMKLCQSLKETDEVEYSKLVAWLHLILFVYLLEMYEQDVPVALKISQTTYDKANTNKSWTIPSHYVHPLRPRNYETDSKPLNVLEVSRIQFYKFFIKVNKWALNEDSKIIYEDEVLATYKLALTQIVKRKPEDGILVLYELITVCYKQGKTLFLFITYLHLSHCFFVLRQTQIANLYLELICQIGKKHGIIILDIITQKQLGMIAACQFDYKISLFHFKRALEQATSSKYFEEELYHEIDEIKGCLGEVTAKYKMTQTKFAQDEEPFDIGLKCTCYMYHNH